MAITSWGYDGAITEGPWADLSYLAGPGVYTIGNGTSHFRVTSVTNLTRTVSVAPGDAYAMGVGCRSDAAEQVSFDSVSSGTRWDMVVLRYNWATNTTSVAVIKGSADDMTAFNLRNATRGAMVDQPLALVQLGTGPVPLDVVDLRAWQFNAGAVAVHDWVRRYVNQVGTQIRIGQKVWQVGINDSGSAQWYLNDLQPTVRSWSATRNNTDAWAANTNGNMAVLNIPNAPAGTYLLSGHCDIRPASATARQGNVTRFLANGQVAQNREFREDIEGYPDWTSPATPSVPYYHAGGNLAVILQARGSGTKEVRFATVMATYIGPSAG